MRCQPAASDNTWRPSACGGEAPPTDCLPSCATLVAMEELPHWEKGTPAVLCVLGLHAIPVSTAVRVASDRVLLALGRERETLRRLRRDPRAALCLLGEGVAFTASGEVRIVGELESADTVVAVELRVQRMQDHLADARTEMLNGARWRWLDERAAAVAPSIVAELERLGGGGGLGARLGRRSPKSRPPRRAE